LLLVVDRRVAAAASSNVATHINPSPMIASDNFIIISFLKCGWGEIARRAEDCWRVQFSGVSSAHKEHETLEPLRAGIIPQTGDAQIRIVQSVALNTNALLVRIKGKIDRRQC
jgi:hypothetical protein